jgi:hypothetical protein
MSLTAWADPEAGKELPVFELDAFDVIEDAKGFSPAFLKEVPTFTYYEQPDLPRGELILALEFMDRYRDAAVPGSVKYASLLHFPVIDGYDQLHLKWICLYFYADRMFGYDPGAQQEQERRFYVPIRYEDREKPQVLFQFAQSYVESVFPGGQEEFYMDEMLDPDDPTAGYEQVVEYIDIPPGRIESILPSEREMTSEELVRLVYRYREDPQVGAPISLGENKQGKTEDPFSWADFWSEMTTNPDPLEVAGQLLVPRWSRIAHFKYPRRILTLWQMEAKERVLLFNIGMRIYAYDEEFGIWKTDATVTDINEKRPLGGLVRYPGVGEIPVVEWEPAKAGKKAAEKAG